MIIWIASYPRSGNNYTRNILRSRYKVKTHAMYDEPPNPKIDVEWARSSTETFLVKTHDLPEDDSPALYLVRDGRDALVSYARYFFTEQNVNNNRRANILVYPAYAQYYLRRRISKKNQYVQPFSLWSMVFKRSRVKAPDSKDLWPIIHDLITYNASFGGWGPNVEAWTQRKAPTQILKFEDLIQHPDPAELIRTTLKVLGYSLDAPVRRPSSFAELQQRRPDLYRKGKVGSHKDEMPADLEALFWECNGQLMERLGYSR